MNIDAQIEQIAKDVDSLLNMYTNIWDRVDGAIVLMPERVDEFERRHAKALKAIDKLRAMKSNAAMREKGQK